MAQGFHRAGGIAIDPALGGAAFIRVDVAAVNGRRELNRFYAGSAIYAITPTTEESALVAVRNLRVRPISLWVLPDSVCALPEPDGGYGNVAYEENDRLLYPNCGHENH